MINIVWHLHLYYLVNQIFLNIFHGLITWSSINTPTLLLSKEATRAHPFTTWQIRWWHWRAHHVHSKILIPLLSVTMPTDQTDYSSPLVASVMQQIWIFNWYHQASQAVLHIVYKYEFSSQKTAISTIKPTRQCSAVCSSVYSTVHYCPI